MVVKNQFVIAESTSKNTYNVVAELLGEGADNKVILDLPCGEGAFSKRMLERGADIFSADYLNIIKIPHPQFSLVDMNERHTPTPCLTPW
jgi:2-polyprenyl-3-methyl-5-hydroxy-6-metoxy-1,4-benzoquinol methylase